MKKLIITILVFLPIYTTAQWEIIHHNNWEGFSSMVALNDSLGLASTRDGQIIKTIDCGRTWEKNLKFNDNCDLNILQFIDEVHGWLKITYNEPTYSYSRLLRTVDGGLIMGKI